MDVNTYRFLVHDFREGIKRAHIDHGNVFYDDKGYFWMANEYNKPEEREDGMAYSKLRLNPAEIPEDLVFYEFRDLDPEDIEGLLAFQQQYGIITSIFRSLHSGVMQGTLQSKILNPTEYFEYDMMTVNATNKIFVRYDPDKDRHVNREEEYKHSRFAESSLLEVTASVKRIQWAVDLLLDSRPENNRDDHNPEFVAKVTSTLAQIVAEYFPLVEYGDDPMAPIPMPLSVLLVAQLLSALCDGEAFHVCQYERCNREFQWKRNKYGVAGRRTGSKYCCEEHQIRQKRINQRRKRQADRLAASGEETGTGKKQSQESGRAKNSRFHHHLPVNSA